MSVFEMDGPFNLTRERERGPAYCAMCRSYGLYG